MKTVNEIKGLLQRSAVVVAVAIIAAVAVMKTARAGGDQPSEHATVAKAIYDEVVKECHHKDHMEPFFFVVATRRSAPTQEEEAKYLASERLFAQAQAKSKCWTKDRWTRYVKAEIADQRYQHAQLKTDQNGTK